MATQTPHDGSYKALFSFSEMVRDLLLGFVDADWVQRLDLDSLEPVNSHYVSEGLATRSDDLVWRVRLRGRDDWLYLYLLIEFQSRDDPSMAVRVMTYLGLLYESLIRHGVIAAGDLLPPVFPIVIYNGVAPWRSAQDVADRLAAFPDTLRPYTPRLRYFLLDEHRIAEAIRAAGKVLPDNLAGVVVGFETMRSRPEMKALGQTLLARLALLPTERFDALGAVFTEWVNRVLARRLDLDENERLLANIQEVTMLSEQRGDLAEIFRNEARAEGRKEGQEEARQQLLLSQLHHRFGDLPEAVVERIKGGSAADMERWALRVLDAPTLEAVFAQAG
ncbi:MAG: Rpn family recombination-promoting nuclease/putative transposase [Burkholderiaceae bacterium]